MAEPPMAELLAVRAGFAATIQDLGRPAFQHLGMPVSGALDPVALRLANALVGNPDDSAVLEFRGLGPSLEVAADSVRIALAGTATPIRLAGPGASELPAHQSLRLARGQRFSIGAPAESGVACLAVEGGFDVPAVLGSRATGIRAGIGGFRGRAIRDGDRLPLACRHAPPRPELRLADTSYLQEGGPFRIVFGPQDDYFTPAARRLLLTGVWRVTPAADRMGMRLDGPKLDHARGWNITSDAIPTGSIQVPGTGLPIILLADHQTTGGYPKIAVIASADIPRLGRLRPGDPVRFAEVTVTAAEQLRREQDRALRRLIAGLAPAAPWLDVGALYRENLVSGVVARHDRNHWSLR